MAASPPLRRFTSLSFGWKAEIRRTVPDRERITIDSVSTPVLLARTPRSSEPPVTPVAATKMSSPETRSSADRIRSRSKPPSTSAVRSPSLRGHSRPWIAPPMHLIAAAEMTPSGVPPMPISMSTPVDGCARRDRRGDVTVANQVHARAGRAQLGDQVVVALALEHDDGEVAHAHALRSGHRPHVLGRRSG